MKQIAQLLVLPCLPLVHAKPLALLVALLRATTTDSALIALVFSKIFPTVGPMLGFSPFFFATTVAGSNGFTWRLSHTDQQRSPFMFLFVHQVCLAAPLACSAQFTRPLEPVLWIPPLVSRAPGRLPATTTLPDLPTTRLLLVLPLAGM